MGLYNTKGSLLRAPLKYLGSGILASYPTIRAFQPAPALSGIAVLRSLSPDSLVLSRVMFLPWMSNNLLPPGLSNGCRRQDKVARIGKRLWVASRLETSYFLYKMIIACKFET